MAEYFRIGSERPFIVFVSASVPAGRAFRDALGGGPAVCVNVADLTGAHAAIAKVRPTVVVCDTEIEGPGGWRDLLPGSGMEPGYALLVAHSTANEALLFEVVEAGGMGVLLKPYPEDKVDWVLKLSENVVGQRRPLIAS